MKRNGRQSDNVIDIRDPKANANYQGVVKQERKARESDRLKSDQSVAYQGNVVSPGDRIVAVLKNPGKATKSRATGENRSPAYRDPPAEQLDKTSRSNYDEVPFFKHKEVPNVYKEEE
ncbi:hypothetical protein EVB99_113 [Rhizobium phage RHph_N3_19]|nr:hypothetical protein EVB99_113 [Rhizobium phage RHph_N3_19]